MITTEFRSINFLNQTGNFDYNINLTVDNSTGYFEFGLSGNKNLTHGALFYRQSGSLDDHSFISDCFTVMYCLFQSGKK